MELPDCPPGAEGYQDTVVEVPRKPDAEDSNCTKNQSTEVYVNTNSRELAELEFKDHLNSLRIKLEDGTTRCMVERRGRDVASKWIYLCFPCAAVCSGETILQTHISGKKHKTKLALRNTWPVSIFEDHPFIKNEKGNQGSKPSESTLQKMADEVSMHNLDTNKLDSKYSKYRYTRCQIQESLDKLKAPLLGVEYLVEFPPEEVHHEPSYLCLLCNKQGAPRTIINHMVCYWHRIHYLWRHFPTAHRMLQPFSNNNQYREGVSVVMGRLVARIQESYGRLKPLCIDKDNFNREKDQISQWVFKGYHFSEKSGATFVEVIDKDLIDSLGRDIPLPDHHKEEVNAKKRDPSPPVVAAPSRVHRGEKERPRMRPSGRRERRTSVDSLSDISLDEPSARGRSNYREYARKTSKVFIRSDRVMHGVSERLTVHKDGRYDKKPKFPNTDYKIKVAAEKTHLAELSAGKTLAYHEKNPEKHPLYPDEWKKFWNRRYKELQAENKDPTKHDFKPEWIVFWTKRMKDLHDDELRKEIAEIHRKMNLPPPEDRRRRSPVRRSPARRSRSPVRRNRSPQYRNLSPAGRRERQRSMSPLSVREAKMRESPARPQSRHSRCSSKTHAKPKPAVINDAVLISDEEFKDNRSPWRRSASADSLGSLPDAKSPTPSQANLRKRPAPPAEPEGPEDVVSSLRVLAALEDHLGSLGPKVMDLMTLALKMEKEQPNSSEQLLENELSVSLIETTKEKLKGAVQAGLLTGGTAAAARRAITKAATLLHMADKHTQAKKQKTAARMSDGGVAVAGVGAVDKAAIAKQMAAALIAQGKTDVTTEELAQLVDAVVGMAEAKKLEAKKVKMAQQAAKEEAQAQARAPSPPARPPSVRPAASAPARRVPSPAPPLPQEPSASALQMLQSAYDENEKRLDKEETPDVMDGLSDSDLKTLLQNFAELSAEEQHGLIAYLKKLEARSPRRVERLREYVSAAPAPEPEPQPPATPAPPPRPEPAAAAQPLPAATLRIDSDEDDDYTVEEVFKSAAKKVKENQIRQEMEVVQKLLSQEPKPKESESKPKEPEPVAAETPSKPTAQSSAANLLALVQASVQASMASSEPVATASTSTQPKIFGDVQEVAQQTPELYSSAAVPAASPVAAQQNYGNQAPQGSLNNQNQHNFDNQGSMGSKNMNQQDYNSSGSIGPMDGFQNQNQQNFAKQGSMVPQNMNQQDYDTQSSVGSMGGHYNESQQNFANQSSMVPQNMNQQDYDNQGSVGSMAQRHQNQSQQNFANQGSMGSQIQQDYSNQESRVGSQNMNQQSYGVGAPQNANNDPDFNAMGGNQQDYGYNNQTEVPQLANRDDFRRGPMRNAPVPNQQGYGQQNPTGAYQDDPHFLQGEQWGRPNEQWTQSTGPYQDGPDGPPNGGYSDPNAYGDGMQYNTPDNYNEGYGQEPYNPRPGPYNYGNEQQASYGNNFHFRGNRPFRGGRARGSRGRARAAHY